MSKKCYKIKRTDTNQFWSGYGSAFSIGGQTWNTSESAAYSLQQQLSYRHASIKDWLHLAVIVEFEIVTNEIGSFTAKEAILRNRLTAKLRKDYGDQFVKHYVKMQQDTTTKNKYKHAVQVYNEDFSEFRETLKGLGYSSRHYKKTDKWLWVEDDEVVLRMKLIEGVSKMVDLAQIEADFQDMVANYSNDKL